MAATDLGPEFDDSSEGWPRRAGGSKKRRKRSGAGRRRVMRVANRLIMEAQARRRALDARPGIETEGRGGAEPGLPAQPATAWCVSRTFD